MIVHRNIHKVINMKMKPLIEEKFNRSGYKKSFVAEKLNISVRQFRKYETGESLVPMDKAYILSRLLGCKIDDLYEWEDEIK